MNVAPEIVAALCEAGSGYLLTPKEWQGSPLDKMKLLWGLSGVESSFGANCTPRHEAGYCHGGRYFDQDRSRQWGCLAHCSFGPWQVMYANFPASVSPVSLVWESDGRVAAQLCRNAAIDLLNRIIGRGAKSLGEIVIGYNGPGNEEVYSARLEKCMAETMPANGARVTV